MATTRSSPINLVLGTANIGDGSRDPQVRFDTPEEVDSILNAFKKRGYNHLDSARMYAGHAPGTSEPRLGAAKAGDTFTIDTKVNSNLGHSKATILSEINDALKALNMKQVNTMYLHFPDRKTDADFKETCEGLDQAYREGKFKNWGICNYTAADVQKFIDICEENGFVKPSVYQGQYNAIVRGAEKELLPLLRKNNMPFYAYSPAAGGFFAGNHKEGREGSRFDQKLFLGGLYGSYYLKPSIAAATEKALLTASEHGISGHAASLRWITHHSALKPAHGDSIIFAASSLTQLNDNIDFFEAGPLPADVVEALEAIYAAIGAGEDEVSYHF